MAFPTYQLTMRSGPTPGKSFPLEGEETLIGRDMANEIAVSDPEVSRRHARFMLREENVFIEDLGSTNGTFLNGERISTPQQLRNGDVVTLGETIVFVFEKSSYDEDATVVSSQPAQTVHTPQQRAPEPQAYQPPPEPAAYKQPQAEEDIVVDRLRKTPPQEYEEKKGGMPTWLIILIVAIVVLVCVIAVTMYFMPASWWCAITFDMLEGCPVP